MAQSGNNLVAGAPPADESAKNAAAAREWLENISARTPAGGTVEVWDGGFFDALCLSNLRVKFTGGGRAIGSFHVPASLSDGEGNWQTGAIATVIDDVGAAAIMSVVGEIKISVDFSISFFSPAKIGEEMEIEASMVEDRGRLTTVIVVIRQKPSGRLVAAGRQWMSFTRESHRHSNL